LKSRRSNISDLLLLVSVLCASCASPRQVPAGASVVLARGDSRVGTYVSTPRSFETRSYWIEHGEGLILIDTQFLLSAADEAVDWAERATGKKVDLAFVLHPNPDKFNGTGRLQIRGIRVVTSEGVRALIPEVHKDRHRWFYGRYQPDYPNEAALPESFGHRSWELALEDGTRLKAHVLGGKGASGAHVAVEWEGHLFVGDLVSGRGHAWLELGEIDEWLKRLEELRALKPKVVHPGRGASGGPELLDQQKEYLERVKRYVLAERPRKSASAETRKAALKRVSDRLAAEFPAYDNHYFVIIGLPAVWEKLAR
jgi:glyoxylase-like metal-dependent hydrolase (beta-lactamase superfamily II)